MDRETLRKHVKEFRESLGPEYTQAKLAQLISAGMSTVARYEQLVPPKGPALADYARVAQELGKPEYASLFMVALVEELGLHKSLGGLFERYLFLRLDSSEQRQAALGFYVAFMTHFHPETFYKSPSAAALDRAAKLIHNLTRKEKS